MFGHAATHVQEMSWICSVAARQALLHMSPKANPAALQVVPTAFLAMVGVPMEVENGQPVQIDLATPLACQAKPQSSAQVPNPEAVFTWSEGSWRRHRRRCEPSGTSRGA